MMVRAVWRFMFQAQVEPNQVIPRIISKVLIAEFIRALVLQLATHGERNLENISGHLAMTMIKLIKAPWINSMAAMDMLRIFGQAHTNTYDIVRVFRLLFWYRTFHYYVGFVRRELLGLNDLAFAIQTRYRTCKDSKHFLFDENHWIWKRLWAFLPKLNHVHARSICLSSLLIFRFLQH